MEIMVSILNPEKKSGRVIQTSENGIMGKEYLGMEGVPAVFFSSKASIVYKYSSFSYILFVN